MEDKKEYIVVCESWEYNDENYYQPEEEPYLLHELKLYTKDEAEKLCRELNEKHGWNDEIWDWNNNDTYIDRRIEPYKIIKLEL